MTDAVARIIDGKAVAEALRFEVAQRAKAFAAASGRKAGLAVILVGDDAASQVYVRSKAKQTAEAGMRSFEHRLPDATSENVLLRLIANLNADASVDGILVQLPLPKHIDQRTVIEAIDPAKDVDGFHPVNVGRLAANAPCLVPCTPKGCLLLAKTAAPSLKGLEAVVVGRSLIVGKPVAQLLLGEDCTVTIAHSATRDLPSVVRRSDLVIAAVGRPQMVRGDWLKPGAIVIDVGINRIGGADGKSRLVGDVAFEEALRVASAVTP
ncbi:MAG: bifunctional methylenetetrahydrofolate dehydrogenase/methenyltetrahydrofolate cyclohydrolase FolD, partial [Proteobacteria bacterium]|nr:bifunctional methylenetetrahydrofolate dehydrogenase/methenyltetrahydrofolate cyclohydrolase FolD [Pseudomonadota bacterium]